jgi:hypothetical protein
MSENSGVRQYYMEKYGHYEGTKRFEAKRAEQERLEEAERLRDEQQEEEDDRRD